MPKVGKQVLMEVNLSCTDVCNFECYIIYYQCKWYI